MPPITYPQQSQLDAYLSNFAVEHVHKPGAFVADLGAPLVPVDRQTDKFVVFGKEALQDPGNIVRGPGAAAIELVESLSDDSYRCEDHAASRVVALQEIVAARGVYEPFERATRVLLDRVVRLKRELDFITTVTAAATYNSTNKKTLVGTSKWTDKTASDPIGDVIAMAKAVALGAGVDLAMMQMIIGWDTFEALKVHPAIKDRLVHTRGGAITLKDISDVFEMPVNLSSARKATAAGVLSFLWPDTVWIGYVTPSPSREDVSFAKTFLWSGAPDTVGGIGVERSDAYPRSRKAEMVDVHFWHSDVKVVTKDAGAIIIDTN